MVQHGKAMTQHNEIAKIMGQIANGLDGVGIAPSGSSTKVVIKGKVVIFFHREGDKDEENVTMVALNGSVFGNPMP
jgi:hypothetical protein